MTSARVIGICLDAGDVERVGTFWSTVLGTPLDVGDDGVGVLRSATLPPLWINPVPEPKVVKNRAHLDLRGPSIDALVELGATALADQGTFRVLADPEGNELCLFPGAAPAAGVAEPFALCVDSDRPEHMATWWQGLLGGEIGPGPDGTLRWLHGAAGLGAVTLKFVRVFDDRTVKNRCHWDVAAADLDVLVAHGATLLALPDGQRAWAVLDDIDGNVFCAFDR